MKPLRPHLALALLLGAGCTPGRAADLPEYPPFEPEEVATEGDESVVAPPRVPPPESGPARDVHFPAIVRRTLGSGLSVDVIESHTLPVVHFSVLVASGLDSDPAELPGLAKFVAEMLKEGTRRRSSEEIAGAFDALGARYGIGAGAETITINVAVAAEEFPAALALVGELLAEPAFDATELDKLKRRETSRLTLEQQDPNQLARRAVRTELYGAHPYSHFDATLASVERITREDLVAWHRANVVPRNTTLVVAGDVNADGIRSVVDRAFARYRGGAAPAPTFPTPPARTERSVVVVDRPGSVQSVIRVANLAIRRGDADYVPLSVANHVLGGGANARLFVDLRERRGLTYGCYSTLVELTDVAPFAVATSVRTAVTVEALDGIFEHLERITTEAIPQEELSFAERYLADSFPLQIDTPGKIVSLVSQQRIFGLPEGYWDTYRSAITRVNADEALEAARAHIRPRESLVVVVGESSAFAEQLTHLGPVRVIDTEGHVLRELPRAR